MSTLLSENLLHTLAEFDQENGGRGVALTRIGKRLGLNVSLLMREYTQLSDARLACDEEGSGRWLVHLTEQGRAQCR